MSTPIAGKTYTFTCAGASPRCLNLYYSNGVANGQNVCLWTADGSPEQQWTFRNDMLYNVRGGNFVLDKYTVSGNSNNNNADVWVPDTDEANNQLIVFANFGNSIDNLVTIKLKHADLYLTAVSDANGSSGGKSAVSAGNVFWAPKNGSNIRQRWLFEEVVAPEEITVTGMPSDAGYTNNTEYFHPDSGMVNGTWAENNGTSKANAVKAFYKKVFQTSSAPDSKCLYNLFGAAYAIGTGYEGQYHSGVDMYTSGSGSIVSAHTGEVTAIGGRYGIVAIYDKDKDVTYLYLHMDTTNTDAQLNKTIYEGDFLGMQSNVGLSGSGNQHLHIEVRAGRKTAPAGLPTVDNPLTSISPYDYL